MGACGGRGVGTMGKAGGLGFLKVGSRRGDLKNLLKPVLKRFNEKTLSRVVSAVEGSRWIEVEAKTVGYVVTASSDTIRSPVRLCDVTVTCVGRRYVCRWWREVPCDVAEF